MTQSGSCTGVAGAASEGPLHWLRRAGTVGFAFFLVKGLVWLVLMITPWLMR